MTRITVAFVALALCLAAVANAYPSLSIKKSGVWYWTGDLAADAIKPASGNPMAGISAGVGGDVAQGLPLTPDQQQSLRRALPNTRVVTGIPKPSGLLGDRGIVVGIVGCHGLSPSTWIRTAQTHVYHRFQCVVNGATFKRIAEFTEPVASLRAQIIASAQPVPQSLLNALIAAYWNLGHYQHFGDHVRITVTLTATGRRSASIK